MSDEWSMSMPLEIPIPGWFPEENRAELERLIIERDIKTVVEVGSFLGLSAVWFAQRVEHVYCVDRWIEDAKYESENNLVGTLRMWGYPCPYDFFHLFRENVMRSGVWHKITPIRGHSHHIIQEVPSVDLVYLDGDHGYVNCRQDIELYRDKAQVCLCGDDYVPRLEADGVTPAFGVIEAVNELLPDAQHVGQFWFLERK